MSERRVLIDVSRLIWRFWRGGLPTGIDRVCLAYVEHFGASARAVVQRRGRYYVLSGKHSDRIFELFSRGPAGFRRNFVKFAVQAFPAARRTPGKKGLLYLNIGHTGLDQPSLPQWIEESGVRAVFFIHDLIPLRYPEFSRAGEPAKHQLRMENVLASARGVIGNSGATLADLAALAADLRVAMPPAITAWIAGPPITPNVKPKRLNRPHFVSVGTIEGRKNHVMLLRIWKEFAAAYGPKAPLLVIVGQRGWEASDAITMLDHSAELKEHVLEFGKCGDDEAAAIIAGARALLMPSFAEGFGLPIAEALELGTPVIASNLAVFREFAGDIPTYLNAADQEAWMAATVDFLKDSEERQRQARAMEGYRAPDWRTHFEIVQAWIETLP